MEIKHLTCICCPLGCQLHAEMQEGRVVSVSGNTCKNGDQYARKELTAPTRIVTTTVRVRGGIRPVVSVKTACDVPKEKIFECMKELKSIELEAPIVMGQTILHGIAGTSIDVVATSAIRKG